MVLRYYNLKLMPFAISPDPKFFWMGREHKTALTALLQGIVHRKNLMLLTGEPGTGKTTLVNALAERLEKDALFARIPDPSLSELEFLNVTAHELGMTEKFDTKDEFLTIFERFLIDARQDKKQVVLIVEEAQRLTAELFDGIHRLSRIGQPQTSLITIILVGHKEFHSTLLLSDAMKHRFAVIYNLEPLNRSEIGAYIEHRLDVAGSRQRIFSAGAIREIYTYSEGNPRMVNNICDRALVMGAKKGKKIIKPDIIITCAAGYNLVPVRKNAISVWRLIKFNYLAPIGAVMIICILGYSYLANLPVNTPMDMASEDLQSFPPGAGAMVEPLELKANMVTQVVPPDPLPAGNQKMDALVLELKNTKARVAQLKRATQEQEHTLSQNTRKIAALVEALEQERRNNEALENELLTKSAVIEELEEMRDKLSSLTVRYKEKIGKSNTEVEKLQAQLRDLQAQKAPAGSSPIISEKRKIQSTEEGTIPIQADQPNPADIIDWIIRKKSE